MKIIKFIMLILIFLIIGQQHKKLNSKLSYIDNIVMPSYGLYYSGWSCLECFTKLEDAIKIINKNANIVTIIYRNKSIVERKKAKNLLKKYIKNNKYFFISKKQFMKLKKRFPRLDNYRTPGLFFFSKSSDVFIEYDSLFNKKRSVFELARLIKIILNKKRITK